MSNLLKAFCLACGQQVSLQKLTVYFSTNTLVAMAQELSVNLEMPVVEDLGMYLGVPMVWGRLKRDALAYIKDRVLAKVMRWKQQFLSQLGKEMFIKAVAMAITTYPMNMFRLLDRLCREIVAAIAKFW
ncbi:uncharacterized protein [Pyrus communis]|uniref:uncharacterized protein n=1 Tax=Pyrus communis TaxID=23211 RepID=UPI0035C05674